MTKNIYRFFLVFFCFLHSSFSAAQSGVAPYIKYSGDLGGENYTVGACIVQTKDGGFLIGGEIRYTYAPDTEIVYSRPYFAKTDSAGNIIWNGALAGEGDNHIASITETNTCYVVAGSEDSATGDFKHFQRGINGYLAWLDKNTGVTKKLIQFPENSGGFVTSITNIGSDTLLVLGMREPDTNYVGGMVWAEFDLSGNKIWEKSMDYPGYTYSLWPRSVIAKKDKGIAIVFDVSYDSSYGQKDTLLQGYKGNTDACILNLDRNGKILWMKCYGGSAGDALLAMKDEYTTSANGVTTTNGFLCTGVSNSTDGDLNGAVSRGADFWAMHIDDTGKVLWSKSYGGSEEDMECNAAFTADGGAVMYGYTDSKDGDCAMNTIGAMEIVDSGRHKW